MRRLTNKQNLRYGTITIGIFLMATLLNICVVTALDIKDNVSQIYIFAVLLVAANTEGYFWGVLTAIMGVIGTNYFFTYPYGILDFTQNGYPVMFLTMLMITVVTSTMTTRIKEQMNLAQEGERKTRELNYINQQLVCTTQRKEIILLMIQYLGQTTQRKVQFSSVEELKEGEGEEYDDYELALLAVEHKMCTGLGTQYEGVHENLYIPIIADHQVLGVVAIECDDGKGIPRKQLEFIQLVLSQFGLALENQRLVEEHQEVVIEKEKEQIRSNLLRAISHDLRTPLTGILGAVNIIKESGTELSNEQASRLIAGISDDAQWLLRMVENILSITRISQGDGPKLNKTLEAVEEVVAQGINRGKKRFPQASFIVQVPEQFMMAPMDATLIEQVLLNFLENAIIHGGNDEMVEVSIVEENGMVAVRVQDYGKGLSEEVQNNLFQEFATRNRKHSDSSRGLGLGLSICRTIIQAHGGTIKGENGMPHGAIFTFTLPIEEVVYESSEKDLDH